MKFMDREGHGFIVIPNFIEKMIEMASETEAEIKLRRFAKSVGNQGLNLKVELVSFSSTGKLNQIQFKRALKSFSIALSDDEIRGLFDA